MIESGVPVDRVRTRHTRRALSTRELQFTPVGDPKSGQAPDTVRYRTFPSVDLTSASRQAAHLHHSAPREGRTEVVPPVTSTVHPEIDVQGSRNHWDPYQ